MDGKEYWDNCDGKNYRILVVAQPSSMPGSPDRSKPSPPGSLSDLISSNAQRGPVLPTLPLSPASSSSNAVRTVALPTVNTAQVGAGSNSPLVHSTSNPLQTQHTYSSSEYIMKQQSVVPVSVLQSSAFVPFPSSLNPSTDPTSIYFKENISAV